MSDTIKIAGKEYIVMTRDELDEKLIDARFSGIASVYEGMEKWNENLQRRNIKG